MSTKDQIRRLWSEAFRDSPEYLDMYFSRIYSDENALVIQNGDGRTVSSLLTATYTMSFHGRTPSVCYIGGAATARHYRGQGFMSRLMLRALDKAYYCCPIKIFRQD